MNKKTMVVLERILLVSFLFDGLILIVLCFLGIAGWIDLPFTKVLMGWLVLSMTCGVVILIALFYKLIRNW